MSTSLDQYVKQHEAAQLEKLRAQVCLIGDISFYADIAPDCCQESGIGMPIVSIIF